MKNFIYLAATLGLAIGTFAQNAVVFQVDMQDFTGSYGQVNLNGGFNGWCGSCAVMTDNDGDNVYQLEVDLPPGTYEYWFTLDGWSHQEMFEDGDACTSTIDGFVMRTIDITEPTTLDVVCYNSCGVCEGITTVVDILEDAPEFTLFESALESAGLLEVFSEEGPFAVFAPTDVAFTTLLETLDITYEEFLSLDGLVDLLAYHVVAANVWSSDLTDEMIITTLAGVDVMVSINMDGVFINDAQVTVADLSADNGVVHVIDAVLVPASFPAPTVMSVINNSPDHSLFASALNATGFDGVIDGAGPFTVFAPTNDAMESFLAEIDITPGEFLLQLDSSSNPNNLLNLTNHIVEGHHLSWDMWNGQTFTTMANESVIVAVDSIEIFVSDAQIIVADILANNGIVHFVGGFLSVPFGCLDVAACNFDPDATVDDGTCIYADGTCEQCDENGAVIFTDINENGICDEVENCQTIDEIFWESADVGVYSSELTHLDSSLIGYQLVVGEPFDVQLVLSMPLTFTDEITGGVFQVLSWSDLFVENLPPGVEVTLPDSLEGGAQACLTLSGADYPTYSGLYEVSIAGEALMNFFGTSISIGEVETSFFLDVIPNPDGVPGCMYVTASNYMPWATLDNGICEFEGCTDIEALNYSPRHTIDDGSCLYNDPDCSAESACAEDLNEDGAVGTPDLLQMLAEFGNECE